MVGRNTSNLLTKELVQAYFVKEGALVEYLDTHEDLIEAEKRYWANAIKTTGNLDLIKQAGLLKEY